MTYIVAFYTLIIHYSDTATKLTSFFYLTKYLEMLLSFFVIITYPKAIG